MKADIKRRTLLKAAAAGATLLAVGGPFLRAAAAEGDLRAVEIDGETVLFTGAGANVLARKTGNGDLLVVDGGLREHANALLDLIAGAMGTDRIATLFNTHWHREQTGLNHLLGERGARIFAHENTRLWLTTEIERLHENRVFEPLPEKALPTETFYHHGDLNHGGTTARYGYLRQAHTDGDIYVHFPYGDILHGGGALNSETWPMIDWWTGGWIGGLVEGVDTLLAVAGPSTVIVPAHGPVMNREELAAQRDMYATIFRRIRELAMSAHGPDETVAARPAEEFEDQMGNSDEFVLQAFRSTYAHFAPDA